MVREWRGGAGKGMEEEGRGSERKGRGNGNGKIRTGLGWARLGWV
jgi:hypothetical protein